MTHTPAALPPNAVIGIVGGGQLGRMSAVAASRLGYKTHILTQDAHGPAAQVCNAVTLGAYDDPAALDNFAKAVDVVTFEFENISADALDRLSRHCPVRPSGHILRISQDRLAEKSFLASAGVPLAPWHAVTDHATLHEAPANWVFRSFSRPPVTGTMARASAAFTPRRSWRMHLRPLPPTRW